MEQAHQAARQTYAFASSGQRNPEREQATLRVWMGAAVLLAYGVFAWWHQSRDASLVTRLVALYVSYGAVTLFVVSRMSATSVPRLTIHDHRGSVAARARARARCRRFDRAAAHLGRVLVSDRLGMPLW